MSDAAWEQIETKLAYLERANAELSDIVFSQQRDIQTLRIQIAALTARWQASQEQETAQSTPEDERPPHY